MRKAGPALGVRDLFEWRAGNRLAADTYDEDMFEVVVADRLGMKETCIQRASLASQTA